MGDGTREDPTQLCMLLCQLLSKDARSIEAENLILPRR